MAVLGCYHHTPQSLVPTCHMPLPPSQHQHCCLHYNNQQHAGPPSPRASSHVFVYAVHCSRTLCSASACIPHNAAQHSRAAGALSQHKSTLAQGLNSQPFKCSRHAATPHTATAEPHTTLATPLHTCTGPTQAQAVQLHPSPTTPAPLLLMLLFTLKWQPLPTDAAAAAAAVPVGGCWLTPGTSSPAQTSF